MRVNGTIPRSSADPCDPSDPLDIWCITLTVGQENFSGGFNNVGYWHPDFSGDLSQTVGALTNRQFTFGGVRYSVLTLNTGVFGNIVDFRLEPTGEAVLRSSG